MDKGKRTFRKIKIFISTSLLFFSACIGYGAYLYQIKPDVTSLKKCLTTSLYKIRLCKSESNYTQLDNIPQYFIDTLIVSEDAGFFYHNGFDWHEIKISFQQNLEKGYFFRGASTLSQQLVKNVFLSSEKTLSRKLTEAFLTYELEQKFSKNEILEKYINVVEFGPNVYGIKKAANYFFNKSPYELNLLESIYLVHGLPNPKSYSRTFRKSELDERSKARMKLLLERLKFYKKIEDFEYENALLELDFFSWN